MIVLHTVVINDRVLATLPNTRTWLFLSFFVKSQESDVLDTVTVTHSESSYKIISSRITAETLLLLDRLTAMLANKY